MNTQQPVWDSNTQRNTRPLSPLPLAAFFAGYRREFGKLSDAQVEPLVQLLQFVVDDPLTSDIRHAAYILANTKHETADTFLPIEEAGHLAGRIADLDAWRRRNLRYYPWHGRGYTQLTWETNYLKFEQLLSIPLTADPSLAMVPEHSYKIMSVGMHRGLFRGKKLTDYINSSSTDYVNARAIINGFVKGKANAIKIAKYAVGFERALGAMVFTR